MSDFETFRTELWYGVTSMDMEDVSDLFHASYVVSRQLEKTSQGSGVIRTTPTH